MSPPRSELEWRYPENCREGDDLDVEAPLPHTLVTRKAIREHRGSPRLI